MIELPADNEAKMEDPPEPGLYEVTWRFQDSTRESGTARWNGSGWIAVDTPGGAVILDFELPRVSP
jgi:hypothetical protein